jgi:hypothetical protein
VMADPPGYDHAARELARQRAMRHDTTMPFPESGLPFRLAMTCYGGEELVRDYAKLAGRIVLQYTEFALTDAERAAMLSYRLALVHNQILRLRYGSQRATGFQSGQLTAVHVPREWWQDVSVDLDANTATANGTTLTGLQIYAGEEQPAPTPAAAPRAVREPTTTTETLESGATEDDGAAETRGRKDHKQKQVIETMLADIRRGKRTLEDLYKNQEQTAGWYGVSRGTMVLARQAVSEIVRNNPDIYRANDNL